MTISPWQLCPLGPAYTLAELCASHWEACPPPWNGAHIQFFTWHMEPPAAPDWGYATADAPDDAFGPLRYTAAR